MKLNDQKCKNCKFARLSAIQSRYENKDWMSCRFTPPLPGSKDRESRFRDWRIVPSDFWCSKWEEYRD